MRNNSGGNIAINHVDYRPFKANRLIRRPDLVIPEGPNEYGMKLVTVGQGSAVAS